MNAGQIIYFTFLSGSILPQFEGQARVSHAVEIYLEDSGHFVIFKKTITEFRLNRINSGVL